MKNQKKQAIKSSKNANVSAEELLPMVASRLKNRDLFPRKTSEAKQFEQTQGANFLKRQIPQNA